MPRSPAAGYEEARIREPPCRRDRPVINVHTHTHTAKPCTSQDPDATPQLASATCHSSPASLVRLLPPHKLLQARHQVRQLCSHAPATTGPPRPVSWITALRHHRTREQQCTCKLPDMKLNFDISGQKLPSLQRFLHDQEGRVSWGKQRRGEIGLWAFAPR